jgi:ABC-type transport system involved in multi-copper enzyme maturation permease subunit
MFSKINVIAKYTALEALRTRLLWVVFFVVIASIGLAEFISQVAITESQQIQSAIVGAILRMVAVLILSLFVITSMVREFNDKGFELVLSLPIPRAGYYFGKFLGYSLVALLIALLFSFPLLIYVPSDQVAMWGLSLFLELLIIAALSLLCLFTFNHVTIAFICVLAFYLLSRSIGAIQLIGHGPLAETHKLSQQVINFIVDTIAYILPALNRFTSTEWLVYHSATMTDLFVVLGQSMIYLLVLSAAALFDLYRKDL